MTYQFAKWMLHYSPYFLAFPVAIALIRFKFMTKALRFVLILLILDVLTEGFMTVLSRNGIRNNLFMVHIYTILEFNIIALFYRQGFGDFYNRKLVPIIMVLFTSFAIINSLFIQKITEFNTYSRGIEAILIVILALLFFYKMLTQLKTKRPEKNPTFWINTGFIFYFAGSLVLFILSNVILKENKEFNYLSWGLHSCLLVLLHLLIGIGLWYSPQQE